MDNSLQTPIKQRGSMLLEALISILIFSIGILAIIGLQASSISMSSDAKYRSDASILANQYIASMWADLATAITATGPAPTFAQTPFNQAEFANFATGGTNFNAWANNVVNSLPAASAAVAINTVITCGTAACPGSPSGVQQNTSTTATVTISWQLPSGGVHNYSTTALISAQKQL